MIFFIYYLFHKITHLSVHTYVILIIVLIIELIYDKYAFLSSYYLLSLPLLSEGRFKTDIDIDTFLFRKSICLIPKKR